MKTKIENEEEFNEAIDAYGREQDALECRISQQKLLRQLIEIYANEHGITRQIASEYRLLMKRGTCALRVEKGKDVRDVIALLQSDETGREFVTATYDSEAIKAHAKTLGEPEEWLAQYGLYLTNAKRHAEIKAA